jgi:hypothetical protein
VGRLEYNKTMNTKKKKSLHELAYDNLDVNVGDRVKVLFKVPSCSQGWETVWRDDAMDEQVGQILKVEKLNARTGVKLSDGFSYPAFALQKVESSIITVALNEAHLKALVYEDKIVIGGQSVNKVQVMELLSATTETGLVDRADLEGLIEDLDNLS